MANSTVRGNKTTKELKKGVSVMKKSLFKALCLVLIIALLAPNAFAATPAPEAPLADAATVERVKQEIANGEITDMEDLFLVAYQHLGADLEEEGMTAYINEDGTLGITQIISSNSSRTRSGMLIEKDIAVTSILFVDNEGNQVSDFELVFIPDDHTYSGGIADLLVYATHTAYYTNKYEDYGYGFIGTEWVKFNFMATTIRYEGSTFTASRLVQYYEGYQGYDFPTVTTDSLTRTSPTATTYEFRPDGTQYYLVRCDEAAGGYIKSRSTIYIANSSRYFTIEAPLDLFGD